MKQKMLEDKFFRHSFGELVPALCRKYGHHQLELVEDAVQTALMKAVDHWPINGVPNNPKGWLYRVASNSFIEQTRSTARRSRMAEDFSSDPLNQPNDDALFSEQSYSENMIQMLFLGSDPLLPLPSQIAFSLRSLCGFGTKEIAARLLTSKANIHQRMSRARSFLKQIDTKVDWLTDPNGELRLSSVLTTLYALFLEGYYSDVGETVIRQDLCDDAIRLTSILAKHPIGQNPNCWALLALMHFHRARLIARQNESFDLVLLSEQDRELYDQHHIRAGLIWLHKSASGNPSRWHAEAGIAAEHCMATKHEDVNWERILACYDILVYVAPSASAQLNRIVALAKVHGALAGLDAISALEFPTWLEGSYKYAAVKAHLFAENGNKNAAKTAFETAIKLAPNSAIRNLLLRSRALKV